MKFSIGEDDRLGVIISSDRYCKRRKDKIILPIVQDDEELSEWTRYEFSSDDGVFEDVNIEEKVVNLALPMTIPEKLIEERIGRFSIIEKKKVIDAFEKKSLNQSEKDGEE